MKEDMTVGIDLAKNIFYLVALNRRGERLWRKRVSRTKLMEFIAQLPPGIIVMEACASSHHWARQCQAHHHQVMLLPAQHIKAYQRGQKNDYNDAEAIAEAALHGRIRPVGIKSLSQQDAQSLHRVREQLQREKTALGNHIRSLMEEYGISFNKGAHVLRKAIPEALEDADNGLTAIIRQLIKSQYDRWLALDTAISDYDDQLQEQAKESIACQLLMTIPGFGPLNSHQFACWLGNGQQFKRGRDAASALGVIPRQHSSGGKSVLLGITKRGDSRLRCNLIMGARAVVTAAKSKSDKLSLWIQQLIERRGFNKAVVAMANKMIRLGWAVVTHQQPYQACTE